MASKPISRALVRKFLSGWVKQGGTAEDFHLLVQDSRSVRGAVTLSRGIGKVVMTRDGIDCDKFPFDFGTSESWDARKIDQVPGRVTDIIRFHSVELELLALDDQAQMTELPSLLVNMPLATDNVLDYLLAHQDELDLFRFCGKKTLLFMGRIYRAPDAAKASDCRVRTLIETRTSEGRLTWEESYTFFHSTVPPESAVILLHKKNQKL